jgi:hypothetical protein
MEELGLRLRGMTPGNSLYRLAKKLGLVRLWDKVRPPVRRF